MRLQSNLMHYLASQVEEERARRCLTQYMDVHTRIATYLLTQYDRSYRESQKAVVDIRPLILTAQELGVARETLSRTLTAFEQRGVLCSRRGLVHIRAPEVLRSIAEGEDGKHF
jgi:CRP-like cAMP-binding protein